MVKFDRARTIHRQDLLRTIAVTVFLTKMGLVNYLLEQSPVYSLWQAPFVADKLAPLLAHNTIQNVRRVLDVGCGPGTNTGLFAHADYLGVDINPKYIETARRKHGRPFVVADITEYNDDTVGQFDFILVNSFLHHVNDTDTAKILSRLPRWLSKNGHVNIIELVAPGDGSIAQLLAGWDRGKYPRRLENWRSLFEQALDVQVFESFPVKCAGTRLWEMVYCRGGAKP